MQTVRIGVDSEHVSIAFPQKPLREGWLDAEVEITVRAFKGKIWPTLEVTDLERFMHSLEQLYASLTGSAELNPREAQFVLKLTARPTGHVHVTGTAWSYATYGNRLEFEIELDQTLLAEPISQLRAILESWTPDT